MQAICSSSSDQMAGQSGVALITGNIESSSVSSDWVLSSPAVTESTMLSKATRDVDGPSKSFFASK